MNPARAASRPGLILSTRGETIALSFIIIGFVASQLLHPFLPGIDFGDGLMMDQYLAGEIRRMLTDTSFWDLFWSGRLPSERDTYHGTLMAYLYLPFLNIFGRNWLVAKTWPVFWAVPTMLFAYMAVRTMYGRRGAFIGLLLLAIHPAYVMGIREGSALLSHMQFFSMGALFFLAQWWKTKKAFWFGLAMAFLGLGQSTQLWFLWFTMALAVNAIVFLPELRESFGLRDWKRSLRVAGTGLFCLLAGGGLIVYREIVHGFDSVQSVMAKLLHFGAAPEPSQYFLAGLFRNLKVVSSYLASRCLIESTFTFKPLEFSPTYPFANPIYPWFILACGLFLFSKRARDVLGKPAVFLPVAMLVMICMSGISDRGGPHLHFFFLYPLPPLMAGVAVAAAWEIAGGRRWPVAALGAAFLIVAAVEMVTLGRYLTRFFSVRHGTLYTDRIYPVADWLRTHNRLSGPFAVFEDSEEVLRRLYFILPESDYRPVYIGLLPTSSPEAGRAAAASVRRAVAAGELLFVRYVNELHTARMNDIRRYLEPDVDFQLLGQVSSAEGILAFEIFSLKLK